MSTQDKLIRAMGLISEALGEISIGKSALVNSVHETTTPSVVEDKTTAQGEGEILAREGQLCYCSMCKADVYKVKYSVYGRNMGIVRFLGAFLPLGKAPVLSRDVLDSVLKDKNGNTLVDCPLCKGDKTLTLLGEADREGKLDINSIVV